MHPAWLFVSISNPEIVFDRAAQKGEANVFKSPVAPVIAGFLNHVTQFFYETYENNFLTGDCF